MIQITLTIDDLQSYRARCNQWYARRQAYVMENVGPLTEGNALSYGGALTKAGSDFDSKNPFPSLFPSV